MPIDQRGHDVVAFLDYHRLSHTAEHYGFAYRYMYGGDEEFSASIAAIVDGGVRITASEVATLAGAPPPAAPLPANDTLAPDVDRVARSVLEIIGDATREAGSFGRELTLAAAELVAAGAPRVHDVVARMVAQAERAEARLVDMGRRTAALREALTALGGAPSAGDPARMLTRAELEVRLAGRSDGTLVAAAAVDGIAAIRAEHGDGLGSRIVSAAADTLHDACRPHPVGRWDADTVVVLFAASEVAAATALLEAGRAAFAARRLKRREDDRPLGAMTLAAGLSYGSVVRAMALLREAIADGGDAVRPGTPA